MLIVAMLMQATSLTYVGAVSDSLHSPARVAVTTDGGLLVTDPSADAVIRFDNTGQLIGTWTVPGGPVGVAAHPDGRYFVSLRDSGKVAIYDGTFAFTGYLAEGTFVGATDIAIAPSSGNVYVADPEGDHVYGFAADGTLVLTLGGRGDADGQFRFPSAVAVDEANGRILVADHDNFRVQVFTTAGVFVTKFGDRNKYYPDGSGEGWLPRSQGLAVDAQGQIYVADAMMSTVRLFSATGAELAKLLEYGTDSGDLRTPCDLALDNTGTQLYVVNTNVSQVEVYAISAPNMRSGDRTRQAPQAFYGSNACDLDSAYQNGEYGRSVWNGPHIIDSPIICGRCHGIRNQPGVDVGLVEGQKVLCMSCHTAGGQALVVPVHELDLASAHPIGVPAVNAEVGSQGPTADGPLALYLDDGNIKCATCHNQHDDTYTPYLRMNNEGAALCKDCHRGDGAPLEHGASAGFDCMTCHDPHSKGTNGSLIRGTINGASVSFTDDSVGVGPGAFVDPDPEVKGICEACHDYPSDNPDIFPQHTLDGTMPVCTTCHSHSKAFVPGLTLPEGQFAGAEACGMCHIDLHSDWAGTLHEQAWINLGGFGQTSPDCLPCHTVGFGEPDGYVDQATTPGLAGVQCENCHGPEAAHASDPTNVAPNIDRSAALCGTCHTGAHEPQYDEWLLSGAHTSSSGDAHSSSCYVCHEPLGQQNGVALNIECAACHNPHAQTGNAANPPAGHDYQLRHPEYVETAPSNDPTECQDPARFNLCGQCHHTRNSVWTDTSRGPHHSLQASVYVGEMPVPDGVNLVPFNSSEHFWLELQCNTCHMYQADYQEGPPEVPAITGHTWAINYEACDGCHGAGQGQIAAENLMAEVQARLDAITAALGDPATWEYSCCGGPSDQSTISIEVKKTRFMKKYIENDGSLGVHNRDYVNSMLDLCEALMGLNPASPVRPASPVLTDAPNR
jgi:predicted CXXCH cytochrome family protein